MEAKRQRLNVKTDTIVNDLEKLGNNVIDSVRIDPGTIQTVLPKIKQVLGDKKLALVFDDNLYYFLTDRTMNNLMTKGIDENAMVNIGGEIVRTKESDAEWVSHSEVSQNVKLIQIKSKPDSRMNRKTKPAGGYFKYLNNTHFDLSRYGVFHEDDRNYHDNCLILALKAGGMSEEKLNGIRSECRNRIIPRIQIKNSICPKYNIVIGVRTIRKDSTRNDIDWYGDKEKTDEVYEIGLVDEQYFIIEKRI